MKPILLFLLCAWSIWSPIVLFWLLAGRLTILRKYSNAIIGVYVSLILLSVMMLSGRYVAGTVFGVVASLLNLKRCSRHYARAAVLK